MEQTTRHNSFTDSHRLFLNKTSDQLFDNQYNLPLTILIVFLSLILITMMFSLITHSGMFGKSINICNKCRGPKKFNYINVGLFKTRHSIYRSEVYKQSMRSKNSSKPPPGNRMKLKAINERAKEVQSNPVNYDMVDERKIFSLKTDIKVGFQ